MSKLYLAGEIKVREFDKLLKMSGFSRRLMSYHYHPGYTEDTRMSHEAGLELFLDSGAFSAFTTGRPIDIEKYAAYLREWGHIYTVRSNLDHIGTTEEGAQKTYDNQKKLESLGAQVHPVFHVREDERWLRKYITEGYDYILIGGLVPEGPVYCKERLDHLFSEIICDTTGLPKVRVHGFGLTSQELMQRYPWYSVDSSSWIQKGMYGLCMMPTPQGFRAVVFSDESLEARRDNGWHYNNLSPVQKKQVDKWLEPVGITAKECSEHYLNRNIVNAWAYQQMEKNLPTHFVHGDTSAGFF